MAQKMTLARPYAKALFEIAHKTHTMPVWRDVLSVLGAIVQEPAIQYLINDRSLAQTRLEKILFGVCGHLLSVQAQPLLTILIFNRRLVLLPEIAMVYEELCLESQQRLKVRYEGCKALTAAEKEKVSQVLSQYFRKTVELDEQINERLWGGYVVRSGSTVIDASVAGYLEYLKGASV